MKNLFTLFVLITLIPMQIIAQIPNSGFELWEDYADPDNPNHVYERPVSWAGCLPNDFNIYSYSIEKSTDTYPISIGEYSIKIMTFICDGVDGIAITGADLIWPMIPVFPVTGFETKLCGYYKFFPENNDTAVVQIQFFSNGTLVSDARNIIPEGSATWTPFSFDIISDNADSASIIITNFNGNGPDVNPPHGNSVLFIDNLSFDNPVTSITTPQLSNYPILFPNPTNGILNLKYSNAEKYNSIVNIYNIDGKLVKTKSFNKSLQKKINTNNLSNGIFLVEIECNNRIIGEKLLINK